MNPLPPDRAHILTEQRNPRSNNLHALSVAETVELINREDQQVINAVSGAAGELARFIELALPGFLRGGRLVYVGAGTSGRLGVLDASEAPPTFCVPPDRIIGIIAGGDGALRKSSEGMEDDPDGARAELEALKLTADDSVLGIASGGTTPYPRGGLAIAKAIAPGCATGLLVCTPVERCPHADVQITLLTGPEVLTGSTRMKAGTATKMALNTISTTLMSQSGRVYQNLMVDVKASNVKLVDRAARTISMLTGLARPEALELLRAAGDSVKTAVVMRWKGVGRAEAEAMLVRAGGRLDIATGRLDIATGREHIATGHSDTGPQ